MNYSHALVILILFVSPAVADDSVFVEGAFTGTWGASFPPFLTNVVGPIHFAAVADADGPGNMNALAGAGTAENLCPGADEKTEYYGGDYDYDKRGEFFACTNGTQLFGVYRDFDGSDSGSITIEQTFPGDLPMWTGTFTNAENSTGAMEGVYQGGGIATPLARVDAQPRLVSLSGASFVNTHGLAPDSFVTAFGQNLAPVTLVDTDLPEMIAGVRVEITDSTGVTQAARLYLVSPGQINYLLPTELAPGLATVVVLNDGEVVASEQVTLAMVAPGVFSAAANGSGVAAAVFVRAEPDGARVDGLIFDANLAPVPIELGPPGSEVYILLFTTGMRYSSGVVSVTVDGLAVPFAGPVAQSQFPGLDQINIGPLPSELAGRGEVEILVTVDGKAANVVTAAF